jgi:protein-disulfide isomerase
MKVLYCANEQGKFWELEKVINDNQSDVADVAKVKSFAAGVGADMDKINSCLDSKKYDSKLVSDTNIGTKSGVNGTPAFFVNKTLVSGAQPFSAFKTVIDAALQAK